MLRFSIPASLSSEGLCVIINAVFCARAVYYNLIEWCDGFKEWRSVNLWRGIFAFVYFSSYLILLFGGVDRLCWSHVMIGISPAVWEIVWTRPARKNRNMRKDFVRAGVRSIESARKTDAA